MTILQQELVENQNYSPYKMDSKKSQDPTTLVLVNKKSYTLEGEYYSKNCGKWNLKHDTSSPKLYELLDK